jgi:uncharacterized membrane protein
MTTNNKTVAENSGSDAHSAAKAGDKNIMAVFAYLWILIIIPFLTDAKEDPFVKYHIKQGLALIIFEVIGWVAGWFLVWIPVLGWLIMMLWWLATLVLAIVGILNVLNGHEKELPFIGQYGKSFKF